jgi:hypothetical protein
MRLLRILASSSESVRAVIVIDTDEQNISASNPHRQLKTCKRRCPSGLYSIGEIGRERKAVIRG